MQSSKTKQIALCGVTAALALVVMFLGAAIGIGTYAGPMIAVFVTIPVVYEYGNKAGFMTWFAVSVLSLILVPDKELAMVYLFFGWYPMSQKYLYRIKAKWLRTAAIWAIYSVCGIGLFKFCALILGIDEAVSQMWQWNLLFYLIAGIAYVYYDRVLLLVRLYWQKKIRKMMRFS